MIKNKSQQEREESSIRTFNNPDNNTIGNPVVQSVEEKEPEKVDLEKLSIEQLKNIADSHNIFIFGRKTKREIINKLTKNGRYFTKRS